jgi:hypothetical protein
MTPLLMTLAVVAALVAVFLLVIGETSLAIAPAVLLLILAGAAAFDSVAAKRKLDRHAGSTPEVDADSRDSFPTMTGDEEAPLGATRESHRELDPHDLPPDHPSREAVEERTGRPGPRDPAPRR